MRKAFVVGGKILPFIGKGHPNFIHPKHPLFGKKSNPSLKDYIINSIQGALKETNIPAKSIQNCFVGNFAGELFCSQGHLGSAVASAHKDLMFVPSMRIEGISCFEVRELFSLGACASGGLAFKSGLDSILAGNDVVLVVGVEVMNTVSARNGGDYLARAADYERQRNLDDFTFPALFAMRKKQYLQLYKHVKEEDIDKISVKAYSNANKNELAHMHAVEMTLEKAKTSPKFLNNPDLKDWLKISDCSQGKYFSTLIQSVTDGAAALILLSEKGLQKYGKSLQDAIEVVACTHSTGNLFDDSQESFTEMKVTKNAAERAYKSSGISPSKINVAEVHDCFTIAEIQMTEALGFAKPGEGAFLNSSIDGDIPINTGGGLIGMVSQLK